MARAVSHYSTYLTQIAALIGIPADRITTEIAAVLNATFNTAISKMWDDAPWIEISPYGEARFLGNRLSYPNNQAQTAYWTATAATLTANSISNPADGFTTATKMMETGASSAHKVVQDVTTFYPSTSYTVSFYARPNGRIWQYLSVTDGVTTYSAFFNTSAGTVGTTSNFTSVTIAQQPNGFWLCQATFTADAAATTSGSYTLQLSTDGSTLSYAGDTAKGCYLWGALVQQTQYTPVQDLVLSWDQLGENEIDAIYNIWPCSPFASNYPSQFGYNITPQGIQVINGTPYNYVVYQNGVAQNNVYGAPPSNPIYIYYRQTCPQYTGDVYDAAETYAVDEQIYFTASDGYGDFYKCIVATSAGQSPTTTPNSWVRITLYDTFLRFCTYRAFGDWLISDGQFDRAQTMYAVADDNMADELDKCERQMNVMSPLKMQSHLTSRPAY